MKKLVFIVLVFIMFFLKNFASANYDKVFYDLQIKSISGEIIDFKKYKDSDYSKEWFDMYDDSNKIDLE